MGLVTDSPCKKRAGNKEIEDGIYILDPKATVRLLASRS